MAIHGNYTEADHAALVLNSGFWRDVGLGNATDYNTAKSWFMSNDDLILSEDTESLSGLSWIDRIDGNLIVTHVENSYAFRAFDNLSFANSIKLQGVKYAGALGLFPLITGLPGGLIMNFCNTSHNEVVPTIIGFSALSSCGGLSLRDNTMTDLSIFSNLTNILGDISLSDSYLLDITHLMNDSLVIGPNAIITFGRPRGNNPGYDELPQLSLETLGNFPDTRFRENYWGRDAMLTSYLPLLQEYDTRESIKLLLEQSHSINAHTELLDNQVLVLENSGESLSLRVDDLESVGVAGPKGDPGDDFNGDSRLAALESSIGTPGTPFVGGRLTGKWEGSPFAIREESEGYWVDEAHGRTHDNIWIDKVVNGDFGFTNISYNPGTMASGSAGVYKYINDQLTNELDYLKQAVIDLQAAQPRESLRVIRNDGNIYDQNTDGTWNNLKSTFAVDNNISQSKMDEMNTDGNYILQTIYLYK